MKDLFFVSCTRGRKEDTDLYRSLRRLGFERYLFFENNEEGLSTRYNSVLEKRNDHGEIVVFAHDDLTIFDAYASEKLNAAIVDLGYCIVGLAGNAAFQIDTDEAITNWLSPRRNLRNLSGIVEHVGRSGLPCVDLYGQLPKYCMVLDGLFLAVDTEKIGTVRFDEQFKFDFYDLDFCLSAHKNGLALGTTNIYVRHNSGGNFAAPKFEATQRLFRQKWLSALDGPPLMEQWSSALAELPVCLPASAWVEHIPFLFLLFRIFRPRIYVELGVDLGTRFLAACQAARRFNAYTKCVGIDSWTSDVRAGLSDENEVFEPLNAFVRSQFKQCELLRQTFDQAVANFPDDSIDLLHIDGLRAYEAVSNDFQTWLPKLSKRSIVLVHGTAVHEEGSGGWRLWDELKKQYPHREFLSGRGLGMLLTGGVYPLEFEQFTAYLSADPENYDLFTSACRAAAQELLRHLRDSHTSMSADASALMSKLVMETVEARGQAPVPEDRKLRRNEMCFCGSGRRYKHCHGRAA